MNIPDTITNQRILLSALNWGMGHVSRDIGLIHELLKKDNVVIFAGDERQIHIVKQYFPLIECVLHEGYPFVFKGKGNFAGDLFWSLPHLFHFMRLERKKTEQLAKDFQISLIISDHRYGFYSGQVRSIFLSHQINLPLGKFQRPVQYWHNRLLKPFDEIWIPDYQDKNLAGDLSKTETTDKVKYIGWLSRFSIYDIDKKEQAKTVVIASGPDIYAQQFLNEQLNNAHLDDAVFVASPEVAIKFSADKRVVSSDLWPETDKQILLAKHIISRSGYSTLMDIKILGITADVIPTKGQAEQEYLANRWKN